MTVFVLPRKEYWVGLRAWRHRTNRVYLAVAWWVIGFNANYDSRWYALLKRLPLA